MRFQKRRTKQEEQHKTLCVFFQKKNPCVSRNIGGVLRFKEEAVLKHTVCLEQHHKNVSSCSSFLLLLLCFFEFLKQEEVLFREEKTDTISFLWTKEKKQLSLTVLLLLFQKNPKKEEEKNPCVSEPSLLFLNSSETQNTTSSFGVLGVLGVLRVSEWVSNVFFSFLSEEEPQKETRNKKFQWCLWVVSC